MEPPSSFLKSRTKCLWQSASRGALAGAPDATPNTSGSTAAICSSKTLMRLFAAISA